METLIIVLLISYNLFLVTYMLFDRRSTDKKIISNDPELPSELISSKKKDDIMGESKFKMQKKVPQAAKSMPLGATREKGEDIADMPTTFASQTQNERSQRVADDDMDSAFEDIRMETTPTSYSDNDDDYDGVPNEAFASGSTFEEIGESMEVANNPNATLEQKQRAGRVFSELEGTILFEEIINSLPKRKMVILDLIDKICIEAELAKDKANSRKEFKPPTTLDKFNIRDYV